MTKYTLSPLGEQAIVVEVGTEIGKVAQEKVRAITTLLDEFPPTWMIEYIPAYTTVTIVYKIECFLSEEKSPFTAVCERIDVLFLQFKTAEQAEQQVINIPVLYGGRYGADIKFVADHNGLTIDEVINIHVTGTYEVHMIGFAPGFPFIGGMSEKISAPRKETPRLLIPERSVGIAGTQTGVYPIATPGGWQLIGRTPLDLFLPELDEPSLLKAGDKIKFYEITEVEYGALRGDA